MCIRDSPNTAHNSSLYTIIALELAAQHAYNLCAGRDIERYKNNLHIFHFKSDQCSNKQNGQDGAIALRREASR